MKVHVKYWYEEQFLPSRRHKKLRSRYVESVVDVDVPQLTDTQFPVAMIVNDYQSVYDDARSYKDFDGNGDFRLFADEIRTYQGNLYRVCRITHGAAVSSNHYEPIDSLSATLEGYRPYRMGGELWSTNAIVKQSNEEQEIAQVRSRANEYVIYDGKIWRKCGEPMYLVLTFGLGHNHGGTGLFIEYDYNPNISKSSYFNALGREKAISYGMQVAGNRGDTQSVPLIRDDARNIEVLMPELVRRDPEREHGDGDPFINAINEITSHSSSALEAGLCTIALTANELKGQEEQTK